MHVHIAISGERTDPVIKGFRLIPGIDKVYLLYSYNYKASADLIMGYLESGGTPAEAVPVHPYDFTEVMDRISEIHAREEASGPNKYTMNVTGGTKPMAFAAYSSAYFVGATVYYVQERDDLPLEEQLLTLLTTRAPRNSRSDRKAREILRYVYSETSAGRTVTNSGIAERFGLSKQQVSYYVSNMRGDGLITAERGADEGGRRNFRYNSVRLTQQGVMEAKFARNK